MRTWLVRTADGVEHVIEAHWIFDNGNGGLLFRRRRTDGDRKTMVVKTFAKGFWLTYEELVNG